MKLIEKEKSQEYEHLLKRVINDFEDTRRNIDIIAKKELLRLIFKRVMVDDAAKADEIFEILMGGEVAPRKKFIQTRAKSVKNLDI